MVVYLLLYSGGRGFKPGLNSCHVEGGVGFFHWGECCRGRINAEQNQTGSRQVGFGAHLFVDVLKKSLLLYKNMVRVY